MLLVKKLLIKILEKCGITWEQFEITTSYASGAVGTRGTQWSTPWTHGSDTILAILPVYVGDSSAYNVQPFFSNNAIYVNFYRASTSAQSNVVAYIRVVRMKKWGGGTA